MWSHEQWIAWLNSTRSEGDGTDDQAVAGGPRSRSVGATVLGAGMLGLQQAIFGPIDEPDIVVVADADGRDDEDLKLDFVPDQPRATSVELRGRWYRGGPPVAGRCPAMRSSETGATAGREAYGGVPTRTSATASWSGRPDAPRGRPLMMNENASVAPPVFSA